MRLRADQVRTYEQKGFLFLSSYYILQQHFTIRSRRHHCDLQQRGERSCMARAPETRFHGKPRRNAHRARAR